MLYDKKISALSDSDYHIIADENTVLLVDVEGSKVYRTSAKGINLFLNKLLDSQSEDLKKDNEGAHYEQCDYWWNTGCLEKVTFNVTSACNLACRYCYAGSGSFGQYEHTNMSAQAAIRYINALLQLGVREINTIQFFGGEPLLAYDTIRTICETCLHLVKEGSLLRMPVFTMITNGTLISEKVKEMVRRFGIKLTVSVDGPDYIHDKQRTTIDGEDTFKTVSTAIDQIPDAVQAVEATYTNIHEKNGMDYNDLRTFLSSRFNIQPWNIEIVDVSGFDCLKPETTFFQHCDLNSNSLASHDPRLLSLFSKERQSGLFCSAGVDSICIMPNGDLYPCHMFAVNPDRRLGNINQSVDFSIMREVVENIPFRRKEDVQECSSCWIRKVCHICPALSEIEKNREMSPFDPELCAFRRKHFEIGLLSALRQESEGK